MKLQCYQQAKSNGWQWDSLGRAYRKQVGKHYFDRTAVVHKHCGSIVLELLDRYKLTERLFHNMLAAMNWAEENFFAKAS